MRQIVSVIMITASLFAWSATTAFSQVTVWSIQEKDRMLQAKIRMKDQAHQKRILDKFNAFYKRVLEIAPELKIQMPMHPAYAEDMVDRDNMTSSVAKKRMYAFTGEPYKLRGKPMDSNTDFMENLARGTKVEVLFMPKLDRKLEGKNVTGKWCAVRAPSGQEGFIPLDLLLRESPRPAVRSDKNRGGRPMVKSSMPVLRDGATGRMVVSADSLNIRTEPDQSSDIMGSLPRNTVVEVLSYSDHQDTIDGSTARWARIRYYQNEGWVFSAYLRAEGEKRGGSPAESPEELQKGDTWYVKSEILRVRDNPSPEGTVLFSIPSHERVRITDTVDEIITLAGNRSKWVEISYNDYSGWVFGSFLSRSRGASMESDDIDKLFIFPMNDPNTPVTSNFGWRTLRGQKNLHRGVDLGAPQGTPVLAAADGTVINIRRDNRNCSSCGYGNCIFLEHRNGYRSVYAHLSEIGAVEGKKYSAGEMIGRVGNTGHSYGAHLHFEIISNEENVDPLTYIHAVIQIVTDAIVAQVSP